MSEDVNVEITLEVKEIARFTAGINPAEFREKKGFELDEASNYQVWDWLLTHQPQSVPLLDSLDWDDADEGSEIIDLQHLD